MATRTSILGGTVSGLRDLLTPKKDKKEEDTTTRQVTPTATIGGVSAKEVISGTKKEEVKVPTTATPSSNRATIGGVSAKEVISGTKKPTIGVGTPVSELSIKPSDVTRSIRPPITISGTDRLQLSDKTPAYGTRQIDITLPKEVTGAQKSLRDTVLSDAISRQEKDIVNSQKILDDKRNEIEDTTKKIKELESKNVKNGQWVGEDDKVFEEYQQLYSDYSRLNSEYDRELNRYIKDAESYKVNVQKLDLSLRQKAFEEAGIGSSFYYTVNRLTLDPKFDLQALIPKTKERKTGPRFGDIAMSSPLTLGVSLATKREVHPESLLFGFIDTKPFYLPTEKDRKAFEKEARGGVFGDIAEFQRKTMDQYNKDIEEYRRLNLDYAMTGQYNPKIAEIAKNLSNVKTGSQWRKTAEDKYVKYGRFPGYFQRYGTEMAGQLLAGEALGLGIQAATKTAVGERIGRTALAEKIVKPAITAYSQSKTVQYASPLIMGAVRGGAEYRKTRDIERAITAGLGQALFVGVPYSARGLKNIKEIKQFQNNFKKLGEELINVESGVPERFADGSFRVQSTGTRSYANLENVVESNVFVSSSGKQITSGEVTTTVFNRQTGEIVTTQKYVLGAGEIKKLNKNLFETELSIIDTLTGKTYFKTAQSLINQYADRSFSIFGNELRDYVSLSKGVGVEDGRITLYDDINIEGTKGAQSIKGFGTGKGARQFVVLDAIPDELMSPEFYPKLTVEPPIKPTKPIKPLTPPTEVDKAKALMSRVTLGVPTPSPVTSSPVSGSTISQSIYRFGTPQYFQTLTPMTFGQSSIVLTPPPTSSLIPPPRLGFTSLFQPVTAVAASAVSTGASNAFADTLKLQPTDNRLTFQTLTMSPKIELLTPAPKTAKVQPKSVSVMDPLTVVQEIQTVQTQRQVQDMSAQQQMMQKQLMQQQQMQQQQFNSIIGLDIPAPQTPYSFTPFGFPAIPGFQWVWDKKTGKWVKRPIKKGVTKKVKTTDTRPTLFQSQLLGEKKSRRGDKGPLSGFEWIR